MEILFDGTPECKSLIRHSFMDHFIPGRPVVYKKKGEIVETLQIHPGNRVHIYTEMWAESTATVMEIM